MKLFLEGSNIKSEQDFHMAFQDMFDIPFYGKNLDALWDALTGIIGAPIVLIWRNSQLSRFAMGSSFDSIIDQFDQTKLWNNKIGRSEDFQYHLE